MKILNPQIINELDAGHRIKLNLGSGGTVRPGFYGVDLLEMPGTDIVANLNEPLDQLPDNSIEEIYSRHTCEHLVNFVELMGELHRVVHPSGRIEIVVPHFSNPYYYSDPTHVRPFGLYSMFYFVDPYDQPARKVPAFYTPYRFKITSIQIKFYRRGLLDYGFHPCMTWLVNQNYWWQDWYERRMCRLIHASEIVYHLSPVKESLRQEPSLSRSVTA